MKKLNVVAGAIKKDELYFVAQRGKTGKTCFKWEFPGGKVEANETKQQAIVRELKEELDADVKVVKEIGTTTCLYTDLEITVTLFLVELIGNSTPKISEHIDMKWCKKEDLLKLDFADADFILIKELIKS